VAGQGGAEDASEPATVRAGEYGGSMERIARAKLGPNATQNQINNYVGQLIEINGIDNPRAVQADWDIVLPDADTPAATDGLGVYGNDIALGERMKAELKAQQAARNVQAAQETVDLAPTIENAIRLGLLDGDQPVAAPAGGEQNYADWLIELEQQRTQNLQTGPGTLVTKDSLRAFDGLLRVTSNPSVPINSVMPTFGGSTQALQERIAAGGYRCVNGPISAEAQDKTVQLQRLGAHEVDAVNASIAAYHAAYNSWQGDPPRMTATPEVYRFAQAYGKLNENQRGYVLASIVNDAVQSPEYMADYRAGGYMRDYDKPLEYAPTLLELINPRTAVRAVLSAGRAASAIATSATAASRGVLDSVMAKGAGALGARGVATVIEPKIAQQMGARGWSKELVDSVIKNPQKTVITKDTRFDPITGRRLNDSATAYIATDGSYVVKNNRTGAIVQISNKNNPNWVAPWE
jgi:hypothetical protein